MTRAERNRRARPWRQSRNRLAWWLGVRWRGGDDRRIRLRPNARAATILLSAIAVGERRAEKRHANRVDHALRRAQVRDYAARRYAA